MSDVAKTMWDFVYAYDAAYDRAARVCGLSASQACLLKAVSDGPSTMGQLATDLLCDASNVTQLVNRLETKGLVTRRVGHLDRRSKTVHITSAGAMLHREVTEAFSFPHEALGCLTPRQQETLADLLSVISGGSDRDMTRPVQA